MYISGETQRVVITLSAVTTHMSRNDVPFLGIHDITIQVNLKHKREHYYSPLTTLLLSRDLVIESTSSVRI